MGKKTIFNNTPNIGFRVFFVIFYVFFAILPDAVSMILADTCGVEEAERNEQCYEVASGYSGFANSLRKNRPSPKENRPPP